MAPVLIVDDDDDIRAALAEVVEAAGYPVEVASDGAQALDLLEAGCAPFVILLDLMMPVMDGWTLLERLRDSPKGLGAIPVVVLTASPSRMRTNLPVSRVMPKPVDLRELLDTVARLSSALASRGSVPPS